MDAEHVALPAAHVCAFLAGENHLPRAETLDPRCTVSNERGAYELNELRPSEYVIAAVADGFLPVRLHSLVLRAGDHRENVDVVMQAGGVLVTGTVSDLGGGPISHARVSAYSTTDYARTACVETDDVGTFRITLWASMIGISAVAEGYNEETEWGAAPGVFLIVLTPASSISGIVVDSRTHLPVADSLVELYAPSRGREFSDLRDTTDDEGRFRFDRLAPDRYAAVARASHGYGRSDGSVRVGLGQHVDDFKISLEPAVDVEGTVLVEGQPPKSCERPERVNAVETVRIGIL